MNSSAQENIAALLVQNPNLLLSCAASSSGVPSQPQSGEQPLESTMLDHSYSSTSGTHSIASFLDSTTDDSLIPQTHTPSDVNSCNSSSSSSSGASTTALTALRQFSFDQFIQKEEGSLTQKEEILGIFF